MPFTNTNLATTPLLETTFISDMRIIVNANTTVLQNKIEDVINTLQIDLVNKYIGDDLPIQKLYTQNLQLSTQMLFKAGTSSGAATIASLTQAGNYSTFTADDLLYTRALSATAPSSKATMRTVVVGGTSGASPLVNPTTSGVPIPGLYVGDTTRPIDAGFYGEVRFEKQAITQSYTNPTREIGLTASDSIYTYGNLVVSRTDPQFIIANLKLPADYTQNSSKAIWLQLHEDFTTSTSRPNVGQSFTVIINQILNSNNSVVGTNNWPAVQDYNDNAAGGLSIMPGYINSGSSGVGSYKTGYINSSLWTTGTYPNSGTSAVTYITNTPATMDVKTYIRLFNTASQTGPAGTSSNQLGASVTLTKIAQTTDSSTYAITGGSNFVIVNS
jgi:hypothetical protein